MTIRNHISDSILELDTSAISIIMWIIIAFILAYIYINYQDMHQNYATLIFHLMPIAISVPFAIYMLITKRTLSGARTCAENLPPELPNP
jgi:magnesium-transporting ATPase (P-type)